MALMPHSQSFQDLGMLADMPAELLDEIFMHIETLQTVAFLSLTCQALWNVGAEHMNRHIAEIAAKYSCAGDRIICVGDLLLEEDLPEGWPTSPQDQALPRSERNTPRNLFNAPACKQFPPDWTTFDLRHEIRKHIVQPGDAGPQRVSFEPLYELRNYDAYKRRPGAIGILRNHTWREYVRESALRALQDLYAGSRVVRMAHVNLGELIMMRICFSSEPAPAAAPAWGGVNLHRGVWAGNRLDVVEASAEWFPDETWRDVTEEVVNEFERIWCAHYGQQVRGS
ncbi:hypothetical protein C8R46DRAFT_1102158 [Mycena filopes]|nr:hypothetical protein C8R46DRAFT_1102158 [Mycena filopes]